MTAASIAKELREGLANTTPGPWECEPQVGRGAWIKSTSNGEEWVALSCGTDEARGASHAAYITSCSPDRIATLIEAFEAMGEALTAYEVFHARLFCTGRPLEQDGKAIDHTDLNEAHSLAKIALAKAGL